MGRAALCMRAAALLAAAGMFIFLAEGISADNDIAEAVAVRVLEPTELVAEIPEEYNTLFELQWGGGSLHQLKGRLATMGCMANTIWLYDNDQWHPYNQYQIPSTFASNVEFQNQYAEFIPAGTLWSDCFRMCEFKYSGDIQTKLCETFEFLRKHNLFNIFPDPINDTSFCTDDFDSLVKQKVLPRLPLHPDTCIVRQENEKVQGYYSNFFNNIPAYPNSAPIVVVYAPNDYVSPNLPSATQQRNKARLLGVEIHELCHINQEWHVAQALQPNNLLWAHSNDLWYETPAGKEFIALTGFTKNGAGNWSLPYTSVYKDIYSINPLELSAEMCMSYIAESIGIENVYKYEFWRKSGGFTLRPTPVDFDTSKYLVPEMVEWLETYMILPQIMEDAGDE